MNKNPLKSMWLDPTKTMRYLISSRPGYGVVVLSVLYGVLLNLRGLYTLPADLGISTPVSFALILTAGSILGLVSIYARGFALSLFSRAFKLRSHGPNLRTAIAWSSLPLLAGETLSFGFLSVEYLLFQRVASGAVPLLIAQIYSISSSFIHVSVFVGAWIWMLILLVSSLSVVFHTNRKRIATMLAVYVIVIELPLLYLEFSL